jgi:hypothetical protein
MQFTLPLTGGVTYINAKACYDRIPENLSNLAAMKQGLPPKIATIHSKTLSSAKYYANHKDGISTLYNQHSPKKQFCGIGQGAGDLPARWGYISDNIISAYSLSSTDAIITLSITSRTSNQKVNAFVDDCCNLTIKSSQPTLCSPTRSSTKRTEMGEIPILCQRKIRIT